MNLNHEMRKSISIATTDCKKRADVERAGFHEFFDFVEKHKKFYRIIKQVEYVDPQLFMWHYRKVAAGYKKGLDKAAESGEFMNGDTELPAYALMGIADFVGMRYVMWGDSMDDNRFNDLIHFVLNGLLKENQPTS